MTKPVQNPINYLVQRRFPAVSLARSFREARKFGSALSASRPVKETLDAAMAYRIELSKLSEGELAARYAEERKNEVAETLARAQQAEEARVFNQPYARADYEYWAKAAHWTLDEAVALSLGKAPEYVNWKMLEPLAFISPFARQYRRRRELALRAVPWKQLFDPVLPGIFLAWTKKLDISVPPNSKPRSLPLPSR